jgi:hypothetical protein
VQVLESFNESLNARPLHIPTSNYLSERDDIYDAAIRKGLRLLRQLECPGGTEQSPYTTPLSLEESGWVRSSGLVDDDIIDELEPVFRDLEITYNQNSRADISWEHKRESRNAQGHIVPVSVYRLYQK